MVLIPISLLIWILYYAVTHGTETTFESVLIIISICSLVVNTIYLATKENKSESYWRKRSNGMEAKEFNCRKDLEELVNNPDSEHSKRIKRALKK